MVTLRAWARDEVPLSLEIAALTAFVVARPVLASFGDAPDVLIAEAVPAVDIVVFALSVVLAPVAVALAAGTLIRVVRPRMRCAAHGLAVAGLAALAVWQVVNLATSLPLVGLALTGIVGGALAGLARVRSPSVATFLRFAAVSAPVFLVEFVFLSTSAVLIWDGGDVETRAAAAVASSLGDDAAPVVMVVLDELPTETLLDGDGRIDAELYPNIARLAADGTWYRNHTTVAGETPEALMAILTGRYPDQSAAPVATARPDNLFTLLSESHEVHAREQLTAFCPPSLCPVSDGPGLAGLVADGVGLWGRYMVRGGSPGIPTRSGDRLGELTEWIDDQDFTAARGPGLFFVHTLLPHVAWEYLPDGTRYRADDLAPGLRPGHVWTDRGTLVGRQRHVLQTQAVDRAVGRLLGRLRAAGSYDDAVVVLTADHGTAFTPGQPRRAATPENVDQIAWTPLVVKAPGQAAGRAGPAAGGIVSDANVSNIDILPTVLDLIGADPPALDLDGRPVGRLGDRSPDEKWMIDYPRSTLSPVDDRGRVRLDAAAGLRRVLEADPVPGAGPGAAWQLVPGAPLVGRSLDEVTVAGVGRGQVSASLDDRFDDLDLDAPLPLEIDVTAGVAAGSPVVAAVNGVISGSTVAERAGDGASHVQILLRPGALGPGDNDVRLFVVDGPPGGEVLREL